MALLKDQCLFPQLDRNQKKFNIRKKETQYKKLQLLFGTEFFNVGYAVFTQYEPTGTINILKDLIKPNPLIK